MDRPNPAFGNRIGNANRPKSKKMNIKYDREQMGLVRDVIERGPNPTELKGAGGGGGSLDGFPMRLGHPKCRFHRRFHYFHHNFTVHRSRSPPHLIETQEEEFRSVSTLFKPISPSNVRPGLSTRSRGRAIELHNTLSADLFVFFWLAMLMGILQYIAIWLGEKGALEHVELDDTEYMTRFM
ncbi:hypothetical protein BDK51DRAFT_30508, partial [Blyttiomyces helicus]